jgi:biopolymer transport protein ExbD
VIGSARFAPFAGLFLILTVTLLSYQSSEGVFVKIAIRPGFCGDGDRPVILRAGPQGALKLYRQPVTLDQIPNRLREIMRHRAHRVMYVTGDHEVVYGEVLRAIDVSSAYVDFVAILTPAVGNSEGDCLGIKLGPFRDEVYGQIPAQVQPVPRWPW